MPDLRTKDFRTIYSNSFRARIGDNDVGLIFSYETQSSENVRLIQDEAEVVVTPRQLKYINHLLRRIIEDIEEVVGEVVLPDFMLDQIKDIDRAREQGKKARGK